MTNPAPKPQLTKVQVLAEFVAPDREDPDYLEPSVFRKEMTPREWASFDLERELARELANQPKPNRAQRRSRKQTKRAPKRKPTKGT
jgi:hypothetical protein